MTRLQDIEQAVQHLPSQEFAVFRAWFLDLDARKWDQSIEEDVQNGKLDALVQEAKLAAARGDTTPL